MDKPIIIGASILEISKTLMYEFHYNFMLKKFHPNDCQVAYTDTDSFIHKLSCDDAYKELIRCNYDRFDTSDFIQPNLYGVEPHNKKVVGKMKDENKGRIVAEFVGLRSKMYALKVYYIEGEEAEEDSDGEKEEDEIKTVKKAKGVKRNVLSNEIVFEDFIKCLTQNTGYVGKQNTMKSHLHQMYTITTEKVMLDSNDDKRHVLQDGIQTLAIGHYKLK